MLTKIHHVGVVVRSAETALGFYRDTLGLAVTKDEVLEDQGIRGVLLAAGEGEIELLEPTRADTGVARFLESKGEGMHHLCFATDDVASELETARSRGLALIDQQPRRGLAGMIAFLHPRATRGVLVEFAQPPESHPAPAPGSGAAVRDLDHLVVAVSDLDAGVKTFVENFGLVERARNEVPTLGIRNAILPIGGAFVELITPLTSDGPVAEFIRDRGEGIYLISLSVADLEAVVAALRAKGLRVSDPIQGSGRRISFISARLTHGVTIQLVETRDDAHS